MATFEEMMLDELEAARRRQTQARPALTPAQAAQARRRAAADARGLGLMRGDIYDARSAAVPAAQAGPAPVGAFAPPAPAVGVPGAINDQREVNRLPPRQPALPPRPAATDAGPPTAAGVLDQQASDSYRASDMLAGLDRRLPSISEGNRFAAIASDPRALATMNDVQRLERTGIQATRDQNGGLVLSQATGVPQRQYAAADGGVTTDYNQSAQYAQGLQVAAADRAALTRMQDERLVREAMFAQNNPSTANRIQASAKIMDAILGRDAQREQARVAATVAANTARYQQGQLQNQSLTAAANAEQALANAANVGIRNQAAAGITDPAARAAAAGGRAVPRDSYSFVPGVTGNDGFLLDRGRGVVRRVQPQLEPNVARGTDGKFYVLGPDGKALREATADELARARQQPR